MYNQEEPFCNPVAPDDFDHRTTIKHVDKQNLSNDDFRKLLMTPRVGPTSEAVLGSKTPYSSKSNRKLLLADNEFKKPENLSSEKKKKKKIYQTVKNEEEDLLAELAKKYRDRAKERRDNSNPDYQNEIVQNTMNYNAIPDLTNSEEAAERRRQMIEESKFLGGDMKHTHLVKGLDYALLKKVKAEIEIQEEEELERLANELDEINEPELKKSEEKDWEIKSILAQNIMKVLSKSNLPERNEYFLHGRMTYIFDLDESSTGDEFTIVIRSKAECPNWDAMNSMSTNDIIINKLINIYSELRQQGGKRKKKDKNNLKETKDFFEKNTFELENTKKKLKKNDINIYDDLDEYIPPDKRVKNDSCNSFIKSTSQKTIHHEESRSSSKNHHHRHHHLENHYKKESKNNETYNYRRKEESSNRDRSSHHNERHRNNKDYKYYSDKKDSVEKSRYSSSKR